MTSSRRDFMKTGALGVSVSFLAPSLLSRSMFGAPAPSGKILVVLQLDGGNDAVNTFIPYTDPRYRALRPGLAIPENEILTLDDRFGLHPSMGRLRELYQSRKMAFINNVGFASLDRSHFRCRDVWQTADDSYGQTQRGVTGWLGRYADLYLEQGATSLTTVAIGNRRSVGFGSREVASATVASAESFDVLTNTDYPDDQQAIVSSLEAMYAQQRAGSEIEVIRNQGGEAFDAIDLLKTIPPPLENHTYPGTNLGRAFRLAARLAAGHVGTHAIWISASGYDTHSNQPNLHRKLLADVSDSLGAFDEDLTARGISDRVMVLVWSEFGRQVAENASMGTDHGKAGTVFVVGNAVKGGTFYGDSIDLGNLDNGDLRTEIDFRSVYSTIIRDWYGNDPDPVLNGSYTNLGFLETRPAVPRRLRSRR